MNELELELEKKILETIIEKREISISFFDIVNRFEEKYSNFKFTENCFPISDYFGSGSGQSSVTSKLLKDNKIDENWLIEYRINNKIKRDFKGLYIFIYNETPFYVGISKGVISRILQHVKGHSHNTSTLAYNIGLIRYKFLNNKDYVGGRKNFDFKNNVEPVKKFLLKQKISFANISNDEELYLFEIFCSMKLKTKLNLFSTH